MTKKEINSLAQQIRYCYAVNKRSSSPSHLYLSSLSGATHQHLSNIEGFSEGRWQSKAFTYSEKSLEDMIPAKDRIVYLTSDSTNVIDELDDSKIYVIGGIVDRNRLTGAAMTRATSLNVATGRLPIKDHLKMSTTKVLTCNHVFEILVKYREYGNDWKKAFLEVIPSRKEVQVIGDESH